MTFVSVVWYFLWYATVRAVRWGWDLDVMMLQKVIYSFTSAMGEIEQMESLTSSVPTLLWPALYSDSTSLSTAL